MAHLINPKNIEVGMRIKKKNWHYHTQITAIGKEKLLGVDSDSDYERSWWIYGEWYLLSKDEYLNN